jgi:glutathione synthase/RimK-type ligase-like ATP-grasp enzyme
VKGRPTGVPGTVLIFSSNADIHARAVSVEVETHFGGRAIILDTTDYPGSWGISAYYGGDEGLSYRISSPDFEVRSCDVAGLWWRRPQPIRISPDIEDPQHVAFCREEARSLLYGLLHSLGDRVINPMCPDLAVTHKPYQLAAAAKFGLPIPRTLISSIPTDVEVFRNELPAGMVFKILTNTDWQMTETRRFEESHREHLSAVKYAPLIFQEEIDKVADVRVTIIDQRAFAVTCQPNHPGAALDWRLDCAVKYKAYDLPDRVADQLVAFHKFLGLRFGAVDLCVAKSGEHIFIETNTAGQFLFAEIHAGQPVARAMAAALLRQS